MTDEPIGNATGNPCDPDAVAMCEALAAALREPEHAARGIPPPRSPAGGDSRLAFFESYFTNFIEGVTFTVEQAEWIVFHDSLPAGRDQDAGDLLGAWQTVADRSERARTPYDAAALLEILKSRHRRLMARRPRMGPGRFKRVPNRVGDHVFVHPECVPGTLERGFELGRELRTPFQRAAYIHFLASEVHPFLDGNGRVSRMMLNAELEAGGQQRIVIPTAFHADYVYALKALSERGRPEPLVLALDFAQRWTASVDWARRTAETVADLERCNAFADPWRGRSKRLQFGCLGDPAGGPMH